MTTCYIGVGSNIGDRRKFIDGSIAELKKVRGVSVIRISSIYETLPVSYIPQGRYLNGVIEIEADLKPMSLLKELNSIEEKLGRKRTVKNAPRTIDLDILYYGDKNIKDKDLVIPHPRIQEREFVLKGLKELGKVSHCHSDCVTMTKTPSLRGPKARSNLKKRDCFAHLKVRSQ